MSACSDQTAPPVQLRAASLQAVSPQPDTSAVGGVRVLQVRAHDAVGAYVPGVEIIWQAQQPGDVIQPAVDTTDAQGLSTAFLQVGTDAGVHGVVATTRNLLSRSFFIIVRPEPLARLTLRPEHLNLVSRQTAQIFAESADTLGNPVAVPLRWVSTNETVATIDSMGVVRARRPGTTTVYANATLPPFMVDSITIEVRAATPARIELHSDATGVVTGAPLRITAIAFDSGDRPIDAVDITWTASNPQILLSPFFETFADSSVMRFAARAPGTSIVEARIGSVAAQTEITAVVEPLVRTTKVTGSFCYAGVTFGPSGQFYAVSNEGGSFGPEDSVAVVVPGRASNSSWTKSAGFGECDRTYPLARNTISIDGEENLYVPAHAGVLSLSGANGATRWQNPIGEVRGNIAISSDGVLFASRDGELVALDARTGSVRWRYALPRNEGFGSPVVDEARGVVYVARWFRISAIDMRTGTKLWELPTPNLFNNEIALASDGTLYVGAVGKVSTVTPDGRMRASAPIAGGVIGSPVIDAAGNVYVLTYDGFVYAFTAALEERWLARVPVVGNYGLASPAVTADGTVYFGNGSDLVAVRAGKVLWLRPNISAFLGQYWGFGFDNDLYAATMDAVHQFRTAGRDPQAQWPMTHRTPDRAARR